VQLISEELLLFEVVGTGMRKFEELRVGRCGILDVVADMPAKFTVAESTTLLPFLFSSQPEVKRTKVRQWLKVGAIVVNEAPTTKFDLVLNPGDVVSIHPSKSAREVKRYLPKEMKIFFEDTHMIVIHKPANLLSIASEAEQEETAYAFLTDYVKFGRGKTKERVWIVHRLDRETSGLMVFAKTAEVKESLQQHWDSATKRYLAVVEGSVKENRGTMRSHLDETSPFKVYTTSPSDRTREAVTHFRVLKRSRGLSLVELTLETGRRHQIRVQLTEMGHPIVGDKKYDAKSDPARRLGLHSYQLELIHPVTRERLSFEDPLPVKLVRLL
jgi:23S rRNA pseudouridine1911/1915/1917 synthase